MSSIINLKIGGVDSFAWVSEILNSKHNMFKIIFKNGYENIFFTDVESGKWIEEDLGFTNLAREIGEQVKNFSRNPYHVPKLLSWHKQIVENQIFNFGFFNFLKEKYRMFEIYNHNKKYLYTLVEMDNEEWQILGNNSFTLRNIDPVFADYVIQVLSTNWAKAR